MEDRINGITSYLRKVAADASETFSVLSAEQLNWKSEQGWSVGQCFEHIVKANTEFYPEFEKLATGSRTNSFWETWSPFSHPVIFKAVALAKVDHIEPVPGPPLPIVGRVEQLLHELRIGIRRFVLGEGFNLFGGRR